MSSAVERSTLSSAFVSLHQSSTQSFNYSSSSHSSSATTVSCAASTGTTLEESRIISTTTTTRQQISSSAATVSSGDVVDRSTPPPPALPEKKRSRRERHPSQYDNVPSVPVCQPTSNSSPTDSKPPPLPLKKKHSMYFTLTKCYGYSNQMVLIVKSCYRS